MVEVAGLMVQEASGLREETEICEAKLWALS